MSQSQSQPNHVIQQSSSRLSIIAFCLAIAAVILPPVVQVLMIWQLNGGPENHVEVAAWGIVAFISMIVSVGFVAWPLSIGAIIVGIIAMRKSPMKRLAKAAVIIGGINTIGVFITVLIASNIFA